MKKLHMMLGAMNLMNHFIPEMEIVQTTKECRDSSIEHTTPLSQPTS